MYVAVLLLSLGTGVEQLGDKFPAGTPSITTVSVSLGLGMMYGAGVCNLGFAAVPGEMGGKRRVGNRVKRQQEQGWHYPRRSQPEPRAEPAPCLASEAASSTLKRDLS